MYEADVLTVTLAASPITLAPMATSVPVPRRVSTGGVVSEPELEGAAGGGRASWGKRKRHRGRGRGSRSQGEHGSQVE